MVAAILDKQCVSREGGSRRLLRHLRKVLQGHKCICVTVTWFLISTAKNLFTFRRDFKKAKDGYFVLRSGVHRLNGAVKQVIALLCFLYSHDNVTIIEFLGTKQCVKKNKRSS